MSLRSTKPLVQSLETPQISRRPTVRAEHIPVALHRFAAPTGPWPWSSGVTSDISNLEHLDEGHRDTADDDLSYELTGPDAWRGYPQSLYRNWTPHALQRSGLRIWLNRKASSETAVYSLDILKNGRFVPLQPLAGKPLDGSTLWDNLNAPRSESLALRCLFVSDLTGTIMQQLGTKYDIEPFFFSSSFNGISSRYQENAQEPESDHITIVLPFLRAVNATTFQVSKDKKDVSDYELVMDVQSPLILHSGKALLLDQISVHLVRHADGATLISLHPDSNFWLTTSAKDMYSRVQMAGKGVYWGRLWKETEDSSFMLLILLWHALYAWDEAMDALFESILYEEKRAMDKNDVAEIEVTHELHNIRSALMLYHGLLKDFEHSVEFIRDHPNPAMLRASSLAATERSNELLKRECHHLLTEIKRLQGTKDMCRERVANAFDLIFRTLTLHDTAYSQMQSWVTQQITYLTTVFLPPTFIATVFGMNLGSFTDGGYGTWHAYLAISIPLVAITGWLVLALQRHQSEPDRSFMMSLLWPFRDLWWALRSLWKPVHEPIRRRLHRTTEVLDTHELSRARGWNRVNQRFSMVLDRDHAYEESRSSVTPLVDVVKTISEHGRMNGSAV